MTASDLAPTIDLAETIVHEGDKREAFKSVDLGDVLIGKELANYAIESFLGKGGMAWVFRATHSTLLRPCAIKVLCPELRQKGRDLLEMFLSEARAAASLVHPNVVTVHNIGEADKKHFIELEYVPGRSLQQVVVTEKQLALVRATDLLLQVTSALAEAHRCGLIHRDLKPANILVRPDGVAKLADFGLAKRVVSGPAAAKRVKRLAGTPYFMAPELFRGASASKQSDVYAMGVSFFYLLTGRFPFVDRDVVRLANLHAEKPIPDPRERCPHLPAEICDFLHRLMAKDPFRRPHDAGAIYAELRELFGRMRDMHALVAEALGDLNLSWESEADRFVVSVPTTEGRLQKVFIQDSPSETWAGRLVRIYSVCAAATDSYFRRALELNATVAHGSLAIEEIEGLPHFVMVNSYPRATCDPEEIRRSVQEIGRWADEVEKALTGKDLH
jgi:serine/threonine-protein kinase